MGIVLGENDDVESALRAAVGPTPHVDFTYDVTLRTLWVTWTPVPRPCFTPEMVDGVLRIGEAIRRTHGRVHPSRDQPIKFVVFASGVPGVFCLGGDLDVFIRAVEAGRNDVVERYGRNGARAVHGMVDGFDAAVVTVALVQGAAIGGGFECACCCDVVIAEEHSTFQLPELKFSMFPGLGMATVMSRRTGSKFVRDMVLTGARVDASNALEKEVIDHVAPRDGGKEYVAAFLRAALPRHSAYLGVFRGLKEADDVTLQRMLREADRWAAAANALAPEDVDTMRGLLAAQRRRFPDTTEGRSLAEPRERLLTTSEA